MPLVVVERGVVGGIGISTTGLILLAAVLAACGGTSSGSSSGRGSSDLDLQAARMAAIGGCQVVSIAESAPPAQGATSDQLRAIQGAFNNTSGPVYPGVSPLLRNLLDASTPAATTRAVHTLQQWCTSHGFAARP